MVSNNKRDKQQNMEIITTLKNFGEQLKIQLDTNLTQLDML